MKLPTLYKKSKSAWEQWTISIGEDNDGAYFEIEYGQLDGAMQYKRNYTVGKNIGRANETTPLEQAKLEAYSRWKKQKDKQYSESMDDKPAILPMLAHKLEDKMKHVKFPCFIQPKLDGIRCLAYMEDGEILLRSRNNKPFDLPHLLRSLRPIFQDSPNIILDGELFNPELTFQQITSLVNKDQENTCKVQYHVYDCVLSVPYVERLKVLQRLPSAIASSVVMVETLSVGSLDDIKLKHARFIQDGYEGSIIRHGELPYEVNVRSNSLLKYKDFLTEEFEIIGAEENIHKPGTCTFILKTEEGYSFSAMPEGDTEHRERLWEESESLMGKMMTVRFFEWTTSEQSVPRFPIAIEVRNYE